MKLEAIILIKILQAALFFGHSKNKFWLCQLNFQISLWTGGLCQGQSQRMCPFRVRRDRIWRKRKNGSARKGRATSRLKSRKPYTFQKKFYLGFNNCRNQLGWRTVLDKKFHRLGSPQYQWGGCFHRSLTKVIIRIQKVKT